MPGVHDIVSIESWLADVREYVSTKAPEVLPLLDVYLGEARFGRQYVASDLTKLSRGASVLEVGAGSLLLSCQLVREGFRVTALEPICGGFSHFERLRELVLFRAELLGCLPKILDITVERLSENSCFDYAFSINVMEHVENVALSISRVVSSLKLGASYRFTCPNYLFPYEPHFNIPTLFSKRFTERIFGNKILLEKNIPDPEGTWKSLNWINVIQINRIVKYLPELKITFNRRHLVDTFARIAFDNNFAMRRSKWLRVVVLLMVWLRLHYLVWCVPAMIQPIIDCVVKRTGVRGVL